MVSRAAASTHDDAPAAPALDAVEAERVAGTLQALATPSRLRILSRLRQGPCTPSELAADVDMEQSSCSHQLRLLRNLGLVVRERQGRSVVYALYDDHVSALLDQAVYHVAHLRVGGVGGVSAGEE
ncbi:ArsR/SmtB family transcription factor [Streptacidiphilus anmyonensis]|uniref:ArsR/SmtB family transcription factor n=1 Tax=Streptacidiphilus anmyonensis TaxID=405782 RepID=UPI0005A90240|nr:metalloregulator ArsR/SmtB family transcription factor [Streptacidiphilus anmyonensis]